MMEAAWCFALASSLAFLGFSLATLWRRYINQQQQLMIAQQSIAMLIDMGDKLNTVMNKLQLEHLECRAEQSRILEEMASRIAILEGKDTPDEIDEQWFTTLDGTKFTAADPRVLLDHEE